MTIGIDRAAFYVPGYYLDLADLAVARDIPVEKYHLGLGQHKMAVLPPDEDIITMAAVAAGRVLEGIDVSTIDMVLFATESSIDQSKSAGMYLHGLLNLAKRCRVVELKQACYGATFGLQMATTWIRQHPNSRVLLVASDVARYGLRTPGEPSQGCGAVAMVVSADPRLLELEQGTGLYSDDIMDFWRPNYRDEALVEGHYSAKMYLHALKQTWQHYQESSGRSFAEHDYFLYHTPVCRLVEKAHKELHKVQGLKLSDEQVRSAVMANLHYLRQIGNTYAAAIYISFIPLLENSEEDLTGIRLGFFSYGSGCVAEYFSGIVQPGYRDHLYCDTHQQMLAQRKALSISQYEQFFSTALPTDGSAKVLPRSDRRSEFRLAAVDAHKRRYEKVPAPTICAKAPGKLILSGEYAVVYGKPAIAVAVNRFIETRISQRDDDALSFNLLDLNYHKSVAWQTLKELKSSLKRKHQKFLNGEGTITDVIKQPFQLAQFAVAHLAEHVAPTVTQQDGVKIETESTIPVGCGMGSSAATVLSMQLALSHYRHCQLDKQQALTLAYESEQLQHGRASQIDLQTILYGGCRYFFQGNSEARTFPLLTMYLVNTGQPEVTTGDCVAQVTANFAADHPIWKKFEAVTMQLDQALQQNNQATIKSLISENHQLLYQIGVVPEPVNKFVAEVEKLSAAAKVCGAGAIRGDHAGVVLVICDDSKQIEPLCQQYGYTIEPLSIAAQGVQIV